MKLLKKNLSIKVFDLYRPKRACLFFKKWSNLPDDLKIKKKYYPTIEKSNLYGNYIKELSIHSLGYAVDMTIVDSITEKELNMGTIFDYFGEEGHLDTNKISEEAHANRKLLIDMMKKNGFTTIPKEWWHFNYDIKLDKKIYYDFVVR